MDKAKVAVDDFLHRKGKHDTTVDEVVAPAVTQETINKTRREEQQTAIDREIHQDHYHTSVQAVKDKEVLPERHEHNVAPVRVEEHHHGKDREVQRSLDQERGHFHDQRIEGSTKETRATAPTVAGEHVHHHVHETIQPVVQKETVQPSVVHTTIPIHEIHHNDPKHHAASALPAISMADFKAQGGTLTGRGERHDGFAGEPKGISSALGSGPHEHGHSSGTTSGPHKSDALNKADPRVDSDRDGSRNAGLAQTSGTGYGQQPGTHATGSTTHGDTPTGHHLGSNTGSSTRDGTHSDLTGSNTGTHGTTGGLGSSGTTGLAGSTPGSHGNTGGLGTSGTTGLDNRGTLGSTDTTGTHGTHHDTTTQPKKVSLLDKLNPKKDADGDGKPGFFK